VLGKRMNTICFVIATKDRPDDLRRMLESLAAQSHLPDLVIVVDSSAAPVRTLVDQFRHLLPLQYLHHQPPSASAQRNAGIEAVPTDIDLIAFLDDDAALEPDALERMLGFWEGAPADLGGAAFNMVNHPIQAFSRLKRWRLVRALGVYSGQPGRVTPSGWQTMTGRVSENTYVDWLPSTAAVWRAGTLKTFHFDEFFTGYSYLEDLDFSYTVRRHWRLAVVADARYCHYPSQIRHSRQYGFGKTEVRNRLYLVTKHRLSYRKCWLGLVLRSLVTLYDSVVHIDRGALSRAFGNYAEMMSELKGLVTQKNPEHRTSG
jgi:glycosyltransferase involved in cell wall biosynthesis